MTGKLVHLRALEPEDLSLLYQWENDTELWTLSNTLAPFSKAVLERFIETSAADIFVNKQLRLMIDEVNTHQTVGTLDIFDFAPEHRRAGLGIFIEKDSRGKGYAMESILLTKKYLFEVLNVHQIFCNIMADNRISICLFQEAGFQLMGRKKDWIWSKNRFVDENMYQCFNDL